MRRYICLWCYDDPKNRLIYVRSGSTIAHSTSYILEGHQPERLFRQNKLFIGKLLHIHMYVCVRRTNERLRRKSWNDCWESLFRWRLPNSHGRLLLIWEDEAATLSSSSWRHLVGVCFYLPPPLAKSIRERRRMRICYLVTILVVWKFHPSPLNSGKVAKIRWLWWWFTLANWLFE